MKFGNEQYLLLVYNTLTKKQYSYYYDYYVRNMTQEEIANKYGVHITTVGKVLKNARKRLIEWGVENV